MVFTQRHCVAGRRPLTTQERRPVVVEIPKVGSNIDGADLHIDQSGIPEEALPHVFERFYRVEKSRGDGQDGTGLGLAIAQRILQLHGSPIAVESVPGAGTSFTFELPVAA